MSPSCFIKWRKSCFCTLTLYLSSTTRSSPVTNQSNGGRCWMHHMIKIINVYSLVLVVMMISFDSEKQKCWKLPEIGDKINLHPYLHRKRSAKPEAVIESLLQWRWWRDLVLLRLQSHLWKKNKKNSSWRNNCWALLKHLSETLYSS